jgi:hypothetical protein
MIASSCGDTQSTVEWNSIKEPAYSIEYPSDWELSKTPTTGVSFAILSQKESNQDNFRENVNLVIQDLSAYDMNLNSYIALSESQIETLVLDGKILESKRIENKDLPFQKMIYTGTQDIFKLQFEQYIWVSKKKAFILTLTCEEAQFSDYIQTGEKILDSFILVED